MRRRDAGLRCVRPPRRCGTRTQRACCAPPPRASRAQHARARLPARACVHGPCLTQAGPDAPPCPAPLPPSSAPLPGDPRWKAGDGMFVNVFGIEKYNCKCVWRGARAAACTWRRDERATRESIARAPPCRCPCLTRPRACPPPPRARCSFFEGEVRALRRVAQPRGRAHAARTSTVTPLAHSDPPGCLRSPPRADRPAGGPRLVHRVRPRRRLLHHHRRHCACARSRRGGRQPGCLGHENPRAGARRRECTAPARSRGAPACAAA